MRTRAYAMLKVPSVTMNDGSPIAVVSQPFSRPKATHTANPTRMARKGFMLELAARPVMSTDDSAMIMPFDRSIPPVRMTSVWPMASVPTTITCCKMSEKFALVRKRSVCVAKKTHARSSAAAGPRIGTPRRRSTIPETRERCGRRGAAVVVVVAAVLMGSSRPLGAATGTPPASRYGEARSLRAPAVGEAVLAVLAVHARLRLVRDEGDARVGVAGRLRLRARVLHHRLDPHGRHLERVLLRGRGDLAVLHTLPATATAVHAHDRDLLLLPGGPDGRVRAEGGGLVDRVDEVDVGVLAEAVLHRRLPLGLIAVRILAAHHLGRGREGGRVRVGLHETQALQEAVV